MTNDKLFNDILQETIAALILVGRMNKVPPEEFQKDLAKHLNNIKEVLPYMEQHK